MALEILLFAPSREQFIAGLCSVQLPDGRPLAWLDEEGELRTVDGVYLDEIAALVKSEAVIGQNGEIIEPAVIAPGHHVNALIVGEVEQILTAGLPQTCADGTPLPLFERTRLAQLIQGLNESKDSFVGEPEGFVGANGVKLFDPALVSNRRRAWFGIS